MTEKSTENLNQPLLDNQNQPAPPNVKVAPIMALFKHADGKDRFQLILGTICALATGCSFPFFMIFFGDILPVFYESNR
jgi:hypothetical protein